jgi:hypothetical protein
LKTVGFKDRQVKQILKKAGFFAKG